MAQVSGGLPTYGVGEGLLTAGWGVALDEGTRLRRPVAACCRAVPTLLRMASPIAAWSNVIGPRDSATYPSRSYLCEETIGLRCFVITSGDGSLPRSTERAIAGTNAAAISNIGRSEASRREYSSAVSTYEKKFVGAGTNRSAALYVCKLARSDELLVLRFTASSTDTGFRPAIRIRSDNAMVGVIATSVAADCLEK
jgi:hypothetical protein